MTVGITELPPEGMQLGGVALAGDADRGTKTTEGLSLLFTTAGITVQGPQPQIERLLVWSGLDTATCREKIALNEGKSEASLPKVIEGRLNGWYKDRVLVDQPFVKDEKQTIGKLLGAATVTEFAQVVVGD